MNFTSDELFNRFILREEYLDDLDKNKIVDDIIQLQNLLKPLGITNKSSVDQLYIVDSKTLFLIHTWQNELYAMKYFKECSRNPSQNIFGLYV